MNKTWINSVLGVLLSLASVGACVAAEPSWSAFRGPDANGISSAKGLPVKWDGSENGRARPTLVGTWFRVSWLTTEWCIAWAVVLEWRRSLSEPEEQAT